MLARRAGLAALLVATCAPGEGATPVPLPPGEYELTVETVLPHLEEALRYATTLARECLREPDATAMFPLLRHQAFTGCRLVPDPQAGDGLRFGLRCANPEAATGSAVFEADGAGLWAVLAIKMGGKNMTLSQRLHGPRLGPCAEPAASDVIPANTSSPR
jgi:hypothetical protein